MWVLSTKAQIVVLICKHVYPLGHLVGPKYKVLVSLYDMNSILSVWRIPTKMRRCYILLVAAEYMWL